MDRSPPGLAFRLVAALSPRMSESQCFGAHRQTVELGGAPEWARARSRTTDDGGACLCVRRFFQKIPFQSHVCRDYKTRRTHRPRRSERRLAVFQFHALTQTRRTEVERLNSHGLKRTASNR